MKLFVFLAAFSLPVFAVNNLNESFDDAFDLPWNTWGNGSFSSTTYDLSGTTSSKFHGVWMPDSNIMGSGGSWVMEVVWTGLAVAGDGNTEVTVKTKVNSGSDTDFRVFLLAAQGGNAALYPQIWDGSSSEKLSISAPSVQLGVPLPSDYTLWLEFTVNGFGDWQMDFFYDIGSGKTFAGSLADEDLGSDSSFDPTTQEFRQELYQYTHGTTTVNTASLDNWSLTAVGSVKVATSPDPFNGQTDVSDTTALNWTPDAEANSQEVYFGTVSGGLSFVKSGDGTLSSVSNIELGGPLDLDKTYYWRVDTDGFVGTEWSLTTVGPNAATSPDPFDGQINVLDTTSLNWTPHAEANTQEVYFGTVSGSLSYVTIGDGTLSSVSNTAIGGPLDFDEMYYWRVDTDGFAGTEWNFVTMKPDLYDLDQSGFIDFDDLIIFIGQWLDVGGCSEPNCADLNDDLSVDLLDFRLLAKYWDNNLLRIVINEFMASNNSTIEDPQEAGEFPDWIELYNADSQIFDLGGMYLTDDLSDPTKWQIPAGISIDPGQFLVFWADDDDGQGDYHTNFKLGADGEEIGLFSSNGILIDSIDFSTLQQVTDISYGRYPDASDNLRFFYSPTPEFPNIGAYLGLVADTKFSHDRGFYTLPGFNVSISCDTAGAEIRYTLDGSTPTESHGTVYTGANGINVDSTTTLRAMAHKPGWLATNVDTQTYVFISDVMTQQEGQAPGPGWPPQNDLPIQEYFYPITKYTQYYDYGLDPDVTGDSAYSDLIDDALLSLPTISLVTDLPNLFDDSTGCYDNPWGSGSGHDITWERPISMELIYPDGTEGFQIDAGIRLRGASGRDGFNPKHSMRFYFRSDYGDASLKYPLFGDEGVDVFDKIDLHEESSIGWALRHQSGSIAIRDWHARTIQKNLGQLCTRSFACHVYINGHYWGLYTIQERPESQFASTYMGGSAEDYDVFKGDGHAVLTDGTSDAYNRLWQAAVNKFDSNVDYFRVQGLNVDGTPNLNPNDPYYERLLDVDNLIDYMLICDFVANWDGPVNGDATAVQNFRAIYNRVNPDGWKFVHHDCEVSLLSVNIDHTGPWPRGENFNYFNPQWLHQQLMTNSEYVIRVADRAYKYFFNDGIMTPIPATATFMELANAIDPAIIAESARWGDAKNDWNIPGSPSTIPRTRNDDWLPTINGLVNNYFNASPKTRTDVVIDHLKNARRLEGSTEIPVPLYPDIDPPVFSINGSPLHNGYVSAGDSLTMTNPNGSGTIYYTLDGTDPRQPLTGTAIGTAYGSAVTLNISTRVKARVLDGSTWSALRDSTYAVGPVAENLRITELMYHPTDPSQAEKDAAGNPNLIDEDFEFVELKNIGTVNINLDLVHFTDGIDFTFDNFPLGNGQFVLVVKNQAAFEARYPGVSPLLIAGTYTGSLSNSGEEIVLRDAIGTEIHDFDFNDTWFVITDGGGYSLDKLDPSTSDPNSWDSQPGWRPSSALNGTPGVADTGHTLQPEDIVISEVATHTDDLVYGDWIEIWNRTGSPVYIGGWFLSDNENDLRKYEIAPGDSRATILPDSYVVFDFVNDFGNPGDSGSLVQFGLSEHGEDVYLTSGSGGVLTGEYSTEQENFGAAENGVTIGMYIKSDASDDFVRLLTDTKGSANNNDPIIGPVVISEIMYNPQDPDSDADAEFIELTNLTGSMVFLYDPANPANTWQIKGAGYAFPQGITLSGNETILITRGDPTQFRTTYSIPGGIDIYGPYSGALDNGGEKVTLIQPGTPDPVTFEVPEIRIDRVNYDDSWYPTTDGGGDSLTRNVLADYGNDLINWQAATPTPGY